MNRKKWLILAVPVLIIIFLGVWRFWPHSLKGMIAGDQEQVIHLVCNANISGVDSGGASYIDSYTMEPLSAREESFKAVMDILNASRYQQDFCNLLPWSVTSVESDGEFDGHTVNILLDWGSTDDKRCFLSFAGKSVTVSVGHNEGFLIYHPTDSDILEQLANYIKTHGVKNESP